MIRPLAGDSVDRRVGNRHSVGIEQDVALGILLDAVELGANVEEYVEITRLPRRGPDRQGVGLVPPAVGEGKIDAAGGGERICRARPGAKEGDRARAAGDDHERAGPLDGGHSARESVGQQGRGAIGHAVTVGVDQADHLPGGVVEIGAAGGGLVQGHE